MNKSQQVKFESLYRKHVSALRRQGKADSTIDVYARAVRRVAQYWDCCPDKLTQEQLEAHFDALVASHSWSTVKVDRNGLQFFYEHVLKRPWTWVDIVKPPQVRVLPDILTLKEIERLINGTRELRYQAFILVAFSMGLRLGEVLCLQVGDIDRERMKVHVRRGKGGKDRLVTLPDLALQTLRDYYLVSFTLPFELRTLAKANSAVVLPLLMQCAADTLKRFARHKAGLEAELGMCAVLHTHTRRLDYHPHVHIVVPGGGVNVERNEWRKLKGQYLFNARALGIAFRGAFLRALSARGLSIPKTPQRWVAQCERVGRGVQALQYLSRYLYRGVISNRNILADDGECITFRYQDGKTKRWQTRTLPGEDFMALLLQHVLPKGLRRARDYGFLHGNARALLKIVQWVLRVPLPKLLAPSKARFRCPHCQGAMLVIRMTPPHLPSG